MKSTAADLENVATRALAVAKTATINRQFLSPAEAERLTGISRWTWRSKAYSGVIASSKVGRRLLLPIAEIDRIIEEGARPRVPSTENDATGDAGRWMTMTKAHVGQLESLDTADERPR